MCGHDHPVFLGLMMFNSFGLILVSLLTDLLYVLLDPRVRSEGSRPSPQTPSRYSAQNPHATTPLHGAPGEGFMGRALRRSLWHRPATIGLVVFVRLAVQPPTPTWGNSLNESR